MEGKKKKEKKRKENRMIVSVSGKEKHEVESNIL